MSDSTFPIVAIGASAGGLGALKSHRRYIIPVNKNAGTAD
jgi:chemotaxis response regulator CheB